MIKSISILFLITIISCSKKVSNQNIEIELDKLYQNQFPSNKPGGSILIKKGDDIIFLNGYGLADLVTKEKITENTIFNTGSISKTFVANGILILQERDSLSLNDNLYKYFDDFENIEISKKVKIKHLLSHTSGLPDNRNIIENRDFYITAKDKENFEPLKRVTKLNFEPGEKFQYSNPSFNGLALIIEEITNEPWQKYVINNVFKPAKMYNSKITNGAYPETGVAHAYDNYYKDGDSIYFGDYYEYDYGEIPTFAAAGNGGVWSSILDLAKYEKAIEENLFLTKEMVRESRTVFYPKNWSDSIKPNVGYSWFIGEKNLFTKPNLFDVKFIHHTGSQGGFRSFYIKIPEKEILFIGLFNRHVDNAEKLIYDSLKAIEKNNWLEKSKEFK